MTDEQKKPSKLDKLLAKRAAIDLEIDLEQRKQLRKQGKLFDSVLALLQHAFSDDIRIFEHNLIEHEGEFYLYRVDPSCIITMPAGWLEIYAADYEEWTHREATDRGEKLNGNRLPKFMAPPHYRCPYCGIVKGVPVARKINTISSGRPLQGRCGKFMFCELCDCELGPHPISILAKS